MLWNKLIWFLQRLYNLSKNDYDKGEGILPVGYG
jgi:hypothetical protein